MAGSRQDYKVGYRKPPIEYRFKKGVSGNPTGRRKRTPQKIGQVARAVMNEEVAVIERGRKVRRSRFLILAVSCLQAGLKGDVQSMQLFLQLKHISLSSAGVERLVIQIEGGFSDLGNGEIDAPPWSISSPMTKAR